MRFKNTACASTYDSCSNCGGYCSAKCNYNTCKNTSMLNKCSYDSACESVCIINTCGAGCSIYNTGGCGNYGSSCSIGCQVECATNPCMTVCIGLATTIIFYITFNTIMIS